MLPIAVLPIAGLLLRVGQPDLLDSASVAAAGEAIFSNLGLLFAIGVAGGLPRGKNGAGGAPRGGAPFGGAQRGGGVVSGAPAAGGRLSRPPAPAGDSRARITARRDSRAWSPIWWRPRGRRF